MATKFDRSGFDVGPEDIVRLQKIFDRICYENPKTDFRVGMPEQAALQRSLWTSCEAETSTRFCSWNAAFCASAKLGAPGNQRPTL